jgi:hypothetical protein
VKRGRMLKKSRHTQPLYLTRMVNIFFSFFFQFIHESLEDLTYDNAAKKKEITVDVSCSDEDKTRHDVN